MWEKNCFLTKKQITHTHEQEDKELSLTGAGGQGQVNQESLLHPFPAFDHLVDQYMALHTLSSAPHHQL